MGMLQLHAADAIAFGHRLGKVQDIQGSGRIRRSPCANFQNPVKVEAHDGDAIELGLEFPTLHVALPVVRTRAYFFAGSTNATMPCGSSGRRVRFGPTPGSDAVTSRYWRPLCSYIEGIPRLAAPSALSHNCFPVRAS